jgi:uncharacterized ferritin-like protein (DUF455 family)
MIAAHFAAAGELSTATIEALAAAQRRVEPAAFVGAWQEIANDERRYDRLAFQHLVSTGYGRANARLEALALEPDPATSHAFAHAVIGRALALFGYPDLPVDRLTILSRAWTTVVG